MNAFGHAALLSASLAFASSCVASDIDQKSTERTLADAFEYISVPENRSDPTSRQIKVAYLPVAGARGGAPTFVFFGGPGESATDYETLDAIRAAHAHLLAQGDVVFIEQRGVGASQPNLDCKPIHFPLNMPVTAESVIGAHQEILPDCIKAKGADMRGYTTNAIADDVDTVRKTLGYDRINVSGGSYGAQQAYFYVRQYGEHVNRAVLSQFLAPGTSLALPSTIDDYLRQIGDRVGPAYGQPSGGGATLTSLVNSVFEKLEAEPVDIEVGDVTVRAGRTDLEIITSLALRRTREAWLLPMLFSQMNEGEFNFIGQVMLQFYRNGFPVNAAVLALDCAAQQIPSRRARFDVEVGASITGAGAHLPFPGVCDSIDHGAVGTDFDDAGTLHGVPTLFIQGELDPRARDENLDEVIAGQENARLLIIGNATHDLGRSVSETIESQLNDIEADFLFKGVWPENERIIIPLSFE